MKKPTEELPSDMITIKDGKALIAVNDLAEAAQHGVEIDSKPYKHDITTHTVVVLVRGEFYQFSYNSSYDHGAGEDAGNWYDEELRKVVPVEVTTIEWRRPGS